MEENDKRTTRAIAATLPPLKEFSSALENETLKVGCWRMAFVLACNVMGMYVRTVLTLDLFHFGRAIQGQNGQIQLWARLKTLIMGLFGVCPQTISIHYTAGKKILEGEIVSSWADAFGGNYGFGTRPKGFSLKAEWV